MELADTVLGGRLRVGRRLGGNEVSSVWEVEDTRDGQWRALEVLHPRLTPRADVVDRFLRDAFAAGRLGEPHLCEVFEAGRLESQAPYLLMELLPGRSLGKRLRYGARLRLPELALIGRHACLGLEAAHAAGILHRDLKPNDLFLTSVDGRLLVKVLGFGAARFDELGPEDGGLIAEDAPPLYMSPERLAGLTDLDARTDVYALGAILYQAAAGRPPFHAASLGALAVRIQQGLAPPLGELCPLLPRQLVAVVERAMHRDRERRFPGVRQLYEALAPFEREVSGAAATPARARLLVLALLLPFSAGAFAFLALRRPPPAQQLPAATKRAPAQDAGALPLLDSPR